MVPGRLKQGEIVACCDHIVAVPGDKPFLVFSTEALFECIDESGKIIRVERVVLCRDCGASDPNELTLTIRAVTRDASLEMAS